jgi:signal transduction histidine kinase
MTPRPTIRMRVALWCALLVTAAGAAVLVGVLLVTKHTLEANAPKPSLTSYSSDPSVLRGEQFSLIERDRLLVEHTIAQVRTDGFIGLAGLAVGSIFIGWVVAGRMLRPATRLAEEARQITASSLDRRIGIAGPSDELKDIADAFDAMLGRLDDAFARQRRFVADAAHELRTPLTVLRTKVDTALDDELMSAEELRSSLHDVGRALDRGTALVEAMLTLSRAEALTRREPVDLAELVSEVVTATPGIESLDVHTTLESAVVTGDPVLLTHLITNLVENAVAYNVPGGRLEASTAADGDSVTVTVTNDGAPIEQSEVASLFMRFHRRDLRDRATGGFGLGLSVVDTIARTHGATVDAVARAQGGLSISVSLPLTTAAPTTAPARTR